MVHYFPGLHLVTWELVPTDWRPLTGLGEQNGPGEWRSRAPSLLPPDWLGVQARDCRQGAGARQKFVGQPLNRKQSGSQKLHRTAA